MGDSKGYQTPLDAPPLFRGLDPAFDGDDAQVTAVSVHGDENSYQRGCRCGDCRAAHVAYNTPRVKARQNALAQLARENALRFRELYEAALEDEGITVRPPGRPPKVGVT